MNYRLTRHDCDPCYTRDKSQAGRRTYLNCDEIEETVNYTDFQANNYKTRRVNLSSNNIKLKKTKTRITSINQNMFHQVCYYQSRFHNSRWKSSYFHSCGDFFCYYRVEINHHFVSSESRVTRAKRVPPSEMPKDLGVAQLEQHNNQAIRRERSEQDRLGCCVASIQLTWAKPSRAKRATLT